MMRLALLLLSAHIAFEDPTGPDSVARARCDAIYEEFTSAFLGWREANRDAKTPEDAEKIPRPDGARCARELLAMAKERPDGPVAVVALARAIQVDPFGPSYGEAVTRLTSGRANDPEVRPALAVIAVDNTRPDVEPYLRRVLRDNPSPETRAWAARSLALHLDRLAGEGRNLRAHPDRIEKVATQFGRAEVDRLLGRDGAALDAEAEGLLELLARDYRDVPCSDGRHPTFGGYAEAVLRERRELVVGKPAPEIRGLDGDGRPLTLSEHRGQVVVLSWWASWCGPCLAMIPHERELAGRYAGRPFAILGVNGDEDPDRMRREVEASRIAWRSWADGGPDGPISTAWDVRGWPTIYVIGRDGVIRYKGHVDRPGLDAAVEAAMAE